jgi:hypothetical protein
MSITFRQASTLIKKYNSGQILKTGEVDDLLEWLKDFKDQLEMEKKVYLSNGKSKNKNT